MAAAFLFEEFRDQETEQRAHHKRYKQRAEQHVEQRQVAGADHLVDQELNAELQGEGERQQRGLSEQREAVDGGLSLVRKRSQGVAAGELLGSDQRGQG